MTTDARLSVGLPGHPKTKRLIRRLGEGAAWKLVCLILWAAANRSDGQLTSMTADDIELAVDWAGKEGAFVAALVEFGFLDGEEGNYAIHDWATHNPWSAGAAARSEKAQWLATCKHHGRARAAELMPDYAARLHKSASVVLSKFSNQSRFCLSYLHPVDGANDESRQADQSDRGTAC